MKEHTLEIPSNLNLNDLLIDKYPEFYSHLDKFYYLIHLIRMKWFNDNRYNKLYRLSKTARKKSFVRLHNEHLRNLLGTHYYLKILEILISENIIERDNQYEVNKYSRGYRLNEIYQNNETKTQIIKDNILMKKIEAKEDLEYQLLGDFNKQILEMIKTRFTFDYDTAFKLVTQQKHTKILDKESMNKSYNQLKELENGNIFMNESKLTGRIFHTYSNLKRELRNFINHISNEKLIEIDLANSQPFFLGLIASQLEPTEDIKNFIEIVKDGKFYTFLRNEFEIPEAVEMKDFKEDVLTMLYCPSFWNTKYKEKFEQLFPTINDLMKVIKAEDYKNLAQELQRMEADIMINTIAPILLENKIDFIPIHDSFMIQESNKEIVLQIIKTEFHKKYNLIPTIKIK